MPVRSLSSSVLKWPDRARVERELRAWAERELERRPELLRLGYFGSYARGDAGVGSDIDLVAVVRESAEAFERRSIGWDLGPLPVPAEIIVYTKQEWSTLLAEGGRFARMLRDEVVWIVASQ
jgi:predicted nucleotidyltransferase